MDNLTILFLTNCELGQASVSLAVAHELLIRRHIVHIASFAPLRNAVSALNHRASASSSTPTSTAVFHLISGPTMKEAVQRRHDLDIFNIHGVGFCGALKTYKTALPTMAIPWDGPEYMEGYQSCVEIIKQMQPDVIVVDPLLNQAKDASASLGHKFVILSPNTFKEHVPQAWLANFWKYPQLCSGWLYPLPWWLLLPNIYLTIRLVMAFTSAPARRKVEEYRNALGIPGPLPNPATEISNKVPLLLQTHPASDFPSVLPAHVTHCAPILRPSGSINEENAELAAWLSRGPTVLTNMGSLVVVGQTSKRQFAEGLRILLDTRPDIQVLWKLQRDTQTDPDETLECINAEIAQGRVRIEEWLPVEPICILLSGHVKCVVHHGGSNSYHEAIRAGIPQIVLPVWFDTYEFAARVEWLGIGVYGNRETAPAVTGGELGRALARVLGSGNESAEMQRRAKAIRSKLGSVEGRVVACEKILDIAKAMVS